ncbi:hypothetical protein PRIC1_011292 [Phytophthora ramorum]
MSSLNGGPSASQPPTAALCDDLAFLPSLRVDEWDSNALLEALDGDIEEFDASEEGNRFSPPVQWGANGPAQRTKKKSKKRNCDPNKARSEQMRDLQRLRREARDLQVKVQQLQGSNNGSSEQPPPNAQDHAMPKVWEDICARQLERRLKTEQENSRLRKRLRTQLKVIHSVKKLLFKRLALQDVRDQVDKRVRRVDIPAGFVKQLAYRIFDELSVGVELSSREVESVLGELETKCPVPIDVETHHLLLRERKNIELFDSRVLPFDVQATGAAWWRRWHMYRGQRSLGDTENVIRERCGLEMVDVKTHKAATFYVQQVLRRQVEEHRVVVVWHSYFEPFTFGETRVHGVTFLLKGYVLMKQLGGDLVGDAETRVQTCYSVTPHYLDPKLRKDAKTNALIKFAVSAIYANNSTINEMVENMLVDQALRKSSSK